MPLFYRMHVKRITGKAGGKGGHFPLFTGRLPGRCLFPDVPFVIEESEVLFAGKCFAIVFRISGSHSPRFCGVLSARYGTFFF